MKLNALIVLTLLVGACERTAAPVGGAGIEHRHLPISFAAFADEICGTWAAGSRDDRSFMLGYYQRLQELGTSREALDFAHQILGDRLLHKCWLAAVELIGLSGSEQDVQRLLDLLVSARPATWDFPNYHEALATGVYLALARRGLGWAVARFGEGHPLSGRILDHLEACAEPSYWEGDVSPRLLAEWYPGVGDMQSVHDSQRFWQAVECISATGYTGASRATAFLTAYHARVAQLNIGPWPEWRDASGSVTLLRRPIQCSVDLRLLGVDQYIERNAGSF